MTFRVRHKIDSNQPVIVKALREAGYCVQHLNQGGGVPDLLVADPSTGELRLLEVKEPGGTFTPTQRDWIGKWPTLVIAVHDADEALIAVGSCGRAPESKGTQ